MKGIKYQLKNIRRDKLCILTFLLPVLIGFALSLLSDVSFSSISEITFGIVKNDLPADTVDWLKSNGNVTVYQKTADLKEAVNDPSSQMIGVLKNDAGIQTIRSGDELQMMSIIGDTLPLLFAERHTVSQYNISMIPLKHNNDILKPLLIVITLVTAMFMGCTFNAMNMISEKEDGIIFINEVLPMTKTQFLIQKLLLGFTGSILSTAITAAVCIRVSLVQLLPLILLILLSAFIAALAGVFIGHFSSGLMVGIVYIKIVMILFLAPPILFYLLVPSSSILHKVSCILPSSAAFYGLMDLLNGKSQDITIYLVVLTVHSLIWLSLYRRLSLRGQKHA